jgi:hypothetical protein
LSDAVANFDCIKDRSAIASKYDYGVPKRASFFGEYVPVAYEYCPLDSDRRDLIWGGHRNIDIRRIGCADCNNDQ